MSAGWYRGWGRGQGGPGLWPGNGPFRHLPPWERPGWLYGPGSCWTLGLWAPRTTVPSAGWATGTPAEIDLLRRQKELLENQIKNIQQTLEQISQRLQELEKSASER
ncbi:MAG: hypothetical protein DRO93_05775 [Candidatus Thorarchaeota archaeon]|nr:MAG: hypothetical protein DRO93_05775 [Candidatus Thorarchaeota archaeon]